MQNILEDKLHNAKERKESMQNEKTTTKITEGIEFFKRHWKIREETRLKNIELFEKHEKMKRENIEVSECFLNFIHNSCLS